MVGGMAISRFFLVLVMALSILAMLAASAAAYPLTRSAGNVTATLSYNDDGPIIKIVRAGETIVDGTFSHPSCSTAWGCVPLSLTPSAKGPALFVQNIDEDPDPEVIVGFNTAQGPSCCFMVRVYDWRNTEYAQMDKSFGRAPVILRNLDRDMLLEFETGDARFSGRFAPHAQSMMPVQYLHLWEFGRPFADVTQHFAYPMRKEAGKALRLARQQCGTPIRGRNSMGYYAAYAANMYRTGKRTAALRQLRIEQRRGCIVGGSAKQRRTFIARLDKYLRAIRYDRRA